MGIVDLHVHSTRSDGSLSPAELVSYALEKNLSAFALTDHDTTQGIAEALEAAKGKDIEVIPGIELSTEYEGKDIHIVGLYIDYEGEEFKKYLQDFRDSRDLRNKKMCQKLQEHGVNITLEDLQAEYPDSVLTRAHYAKYMLKKGYVKSMPEAFDRYVGDHAPCFLPREKVTPSQAVSLIRRAGGIPILAHPILYHMSKERLDKLVRTLKADGLVGIEAIYSTYNASEERQIRELANRYHLLISGGSDFHGTTKPGLDLAVGYGKLVIPSEILDALKKSQTKKGKILFSDMDGTLLTDDKDIPEADMNALKAFFAKGGKLVLSSGRPLRSILQLAQKFGLDLPGTYIISFNGALVYDCDSKKAIYESTLPISYVKKLTEIADRHGVYIQTYETDEHYIDTIITRKAGEELDYYRHNIHLNHVVTDDMADYLTKEPYKMIAIKLEDNHDALDAFQDEVRRTMGGEVQTFYSGPYYTECLYKTASKGVALKFLCDYLGIPVEESVACGDAANDIPMIEAAGIGVSMINGMEETRLAADYITLNDNNHDGMKEIIERFLL